MVKKLRQIVLFGGVLAFAACSSPEKLERDNIAFQQKHFVGKTASGNPLYRQELLGKGRLPRRENPLLGHTDETVRQIPISLLPQPSLDGITARFFKNWCERDGYRSYRIVENEHNGNFRVKVSTTSGRSYLPWYDVTAECLK
ncbi:hypothetical protein [uncultured Tateyamaria sp.]|uniref:hypothetical protein n=1 Tax=uncultured Tateyamaria sp. TaxID=455651 RepID=UPI00263964A4|nr:hypothetical protein [uncultured Tateyamaria sp.]